MPPATRSALLDERAIARALHRMASEIVEKCRGTDGLVLVGIQRRGVHLAERLARLIGEREGVTIPCGKLDITLYRDDLQAVGARPVVGQTDLPVDLDGKTVVIVDDVLYTGRTVRAALDECTDFGRPRRVLLCVLVDRGGRELPIQADIAAISVATGPDDRIDVQVTELDGHDGVELVRGASA
jgi:pyrimidine operon attenuation protein/uracil phosphoribosyltransferase